MEKEPYRISPLDLGPMSVREALLLILNQVDYTAGACRVNEMVGAVLPVDILRQAKQALAQDKKE